MKCRNDLMTALDDLVSQHGIIAVVDALGDLCAEQARRIGTAVSNAHNEGGGLGEIFRSLFDEPAKSRKPS